MRFFKRHTFPLFFLFLASCFLLRSSGGALPAPRGYVNDFASLLSPANRQELENLSGRLKRETGIELAIATVPSLEGLEIEDYAVRLFETWGIGKKEKDNGLLFLIAPNERKARMEVGYGLEGILNDAKATRILREQFIPYAKQRDFESGIRQTTFLLYRILKGEITYVEQKQAVIPLPVFYVLFALFLLFSFLKGPSGYIPRRSIGGFGGGLGGGFRSGGGGFGGFGGGRSGGGGGSASW